MPPMPQDSQPRKYAVTELSLVIRAAGRQGYAVYDDRPQSGTELLCCGTLEACNTFIASWFMHEKSKAKPS